MMRYVRASFYSLMISSSWTLDLLGATTEAGKHPILEPGYSEGSAATVKLCNGRRLKQILVVELNCPPFPAKKHQMGTRVPSMPCEGA